MSHVPVLIISTYCDEYRPAQTRCYSSTLVLWWLLGFELTVDVYVSIVLCFLNAFLCQRWQKLHIARADSLARDLYDKDVDGFWKAVHKMNACNNVQANVIDGITGQDSIANYWKEHFYKILNANNCDPNLTAGIARKLQNVQHDSNMAVSAKSITEIVSKLECAKYAWNGYVHIYIKRIY